jgi:ATP/maltotriose-dependent transcriptional regulator MalT
VSRAAVPGVRRACVRDLLLAELERLDPDLIPVLRRRAARWLLDNGLPEEALEYSMSAGDADTAALVKPADS